MSAQEGIRVALPRQRVLLGLGGVLLGVQGAILLRAKAEGPGEVDLFGPPVVREGSHMLQYVFDPCWYAPTPSGLLVSLTLLLLLALAHQAARLSAVRAASPSRRAAIGRLLLGVALFAAGLPLVEGSLQICRRVIPPRLLVEESDLVSRLDQPPSDGDQDGRSCLYLWTLPPRSGPQEARPREGNSFGLRERDIPLRKAPGEFRILCLGDSWTFGLGVPVASAWPSRLESMLQGRLAGRRVTVINAGMPSQGYLQAYLMLSHIGMQYDPDLVLCGGLHESRGVPDLEVPAADSHDAWMRRSMLYRVARRLWSPDGSGQMADQRYAGKMVALLEGHGIPTLFFQHVQGLDEATWEPLTRLRRQLGPAAAARLVVSLQPPLFTNAPREFLLDDGRHPTAAGHEAIARELCRALQGVPMGPHPTVAQLPAAGRRAPDLALGDETRPDPPRRSP